MIFLIDDTPLNAVNGEYILDEKYQEYLFHITSIEQYKDKKSLVCKADCVLVHRTFDNAQFVKEQVLELCDDGDLIPIVVFSGGDTSVVYDQGSEQIRSVEQMNKSLFYERFEAFLDFYCENKKVDLRIIAEGKGYLSKKINRWAIAVKRLLNNKNGKVSSEDANILKNSEELIKIIESSQPTIGISKDQLSNIISSSSYEQIQDNINRIVISFLKYGKNINSWK